MSLPPQAWIIQNKLVFNEIDSRGFVIAFYKINPPDIHNASNQFSNGWEAQVVNFLNSLSEDYPFQIRWRVHSNFQSELLQFDADTDTFSPDPKDWTHQERKRTFKKLWRAMEERKLRREECVIAIKRKIRTNPKLGIDPQKNQEALEMVLNEIESDFRVKEGVLQSRLGGRGCTIKRLDDKEIALEFSYFLNPSYYDRFNYDPLDNFDSDETVQMNFFNSSVVGAGEEGWKGFFNRLGFRHKKDELPYGFYSDGYYHNIIALKRKPRSTEMGDFHALTSLGFLDYEIVVNIYPLSPQAEIDKAELLINRLDNDYQEEKKHSYLKGIKREQNKVDDLSEGYTRPFHVEYLIHVWAPEQNMLHNKTEAIKSALQSINQAQIAEINIPTTAINLWHNCWPGNLNDGYKYRQIYFQSENLSNLIPLSSSFVGILDKPESLYVGTNGNLVGLKGFVDGQPQHASMFGSSGGGKSVSICTELSMTRCFYDYIVVIEEGFAYYRLFKKYGFESFVISPNSRITLNYFDTQGLPLTNEHMDFVIAIVSKMAGEMASQAEQDQRTGVISKIVNDLYDHFFKEWMRNHREEFNNVIDTAIVVKKIFLTLKDASLAEAWTVFKEEKDNPEYPIKNILSQITETQRVDFYNNREGKRYVRNIVFAFFKPEEFPQHEHLFRAMKGPKTQEHDPVLVNAIASNLYAWCKSGPYGCLFDGVTNVNLKQAMIHFELSLIKNDKMKALAGFLIMNVCRSEIMNRPRTQRKWVIFEEVARFLNVPGGDEIVKEYYKQMRKYRCRVLTITQEFTDFANSIVKQPIMNNSDQIFLLRLSKGELDLIVEVKPDLPENIQEEVLQYTKPQHQPVGNKYNAFAYYHTGQARPITGTVHNYASPEMIEVAASSYDDFKTRDIKSLLMESTEN